MKVYTKLVINMETLEVEETEGFEYHGPVAECKGGGGGAEPDKKYNKGMLKISERQQDMADEMFNLFKYGVTYNPDQQVVSDEYKAWKAGGKVGDMPEKYTGETLGQKRGYDPDGVTSEMELTQMGIESEAELLPLQTELAKTQIGTAQERQGLLGSIYKDALSGVDVESRVSQHRAGVEQAFKNQQGIANRNLSRMGIDPSSGRGLAMTAGIGLEKAKATAAGETQVRTGAEQENWQRKATAAGLNI